jgi:uroporphyrinogen decarboxylase
MTNRELALAILNYKNYDRLPVVHFGYWKETLLKWAQEGHIAIEDAENWQDGTPICKRISDKLGFDFTWFNTFLGFTLLSPPFEPEVLKVHPDGSKEYFDKNGVVVLVKDDAGSIPSEISHTLKDRNSWEEHYKPRLQFSAESVTESFVNTDQEFLPYQNGGLEFLKDENRENPIGLMVGSLLGKIRDWLGVVGLSYIIFDDEPLLDEIIETVGEFCYKRAEYVLNSGAKFDFAHYWEDICFKNGPLITPQFFDDKIGPQYKRIAGLLEDYEIKIVSVDCDGVIDSLIPTWFNNGVNTMFPIEVGTWGAQISPWRKKYGKELRGVGGMNKTVFSKDYSAVDKEIERLKPLVDLGGYIPCPDHRIAPDAKWENVQYYCQRMKDSFSD